MEASARRAEVVPTPREIYEQLDRYVIGQHEAKRAVAIAAYAHARRIEARRRRVDALPKKSNILLIGPTGSGKTHLARKLAEILAVPFSTVDATEYTEAGYYGKDVEVMIADLLFKANQTVEEAQGGIVFIDEVDKIARRTQGARNGAGSRDIGGEGVQQALLKLLEGREVFVPLNLTQSWNKHDYVQVNTQDILFICAGTFSDLLGLGSQGARPIGFEARGHRRPTRRLGIKDLVEFGMLAEFLGRLPVMVQLEELTHDELRRVLVEPPDALTREYQELLALDEIDLEFSEGALDAVVAHTLERGVGARGLRATLERVMADVLFEAPEQRQRRVVLEADQVRARLAREAGRL